MKPIKVKRSKFLAVAKQLRETNRTQADIGADYELSASTVSAINRAGTWGNFIARTNAAKPIRKPVRPEAPTKYEQAKAGGLSPVTREQRAERKFANELKKLDERYAPYKDTWANIERLDERISTVNAKVKVKADEPTDPQVVFDLVFSWGTLAIAATALILAIIK